VDLKSDDLRVALTALRDLLADRLLDAEPRDSASLAKQLADVMSRIDGLPSVQEGSELDDLSAVRARRRAGLSGDSSEGVVGG
jgi:hypothetical protein